MRYLISLIAFRLISFSSLSSSSRHLIFGKTSLGNWENVKMKSPEEPWKAASSKMAAYIEAWRRWEAHPSLRLSLQLISRCWLSGAQTLIALIFMTIISTWGTAHWIFMLLARASRIPACVCAYVCVWLSRLIRSAFTFKHARRAGALVSFYDVFLQLERTVLSLNYVLYLNLLLVLIDDRTRRRHEQELQTEPNVSVPGFCPSCRPLMSFVRPLVLGLGAAAQVETARGGLFPGTLTVVLRRSISFPWTFCM